MLIVYVSTLVSGVVPQARDIMSQFNQLQVIFLPVFTLHPTYTDVTNNTKKRKVSFNDQENKEDKNHDNEVEMRDEPETEPLANRNVVQWTPEMDMELFVTTLGTLKEIKSKLKTLKREEPTLMLNTIQNKFKQMENFCDDDFQIFIRQLEEIY